MLADDLAAVLPELRRQAESRMRTRCVVRRPLGTTADPATGADVTGYFPVWEGFCRVQTREGFTLAESVEASVTTQRYQLHVPVGAGPFDVGDEALVAGRAFRIDGLHLKDEQTAQRLPVTEIPAPVDLNTVEADFDDGSVAL